MGSLRIKICPCCSYFDETIEHLLFDCHWARAVWFGCNIPLNMGFGHPSSVLKWTSQVVETLTIKGACDLLGRAAFFFFLGN